MADNLKPPTPHIASGIS